MKSNLVFRFGGKSLLTSDKMSRELHRNGAFFRHAAIGRPARDRNSACHARGRMLVYPRMKRIGTISCISSIILLSSCTLTQQQLPVNQEDAAAQLLAAQELDLALEQEQQTILEEAREAAEAAEKARLEAEAREAAEEKAREEAEALAKAQEEAEERAREEAEAAEEEARRKAEEEEQKIHDAEEQAEQTADDNVPHLLNSRRKGKKELTKKEEPITPTAEQQEAARQLMQEQKRKEEAKAAKASEARKQAPAPEPTPVVEEKQDLRSTLRMRRFAPPEEEISRSDNDEPLPNSVELRGFRSPTMKSKLPMNIDGKIIKED